MPTSFRAGAWLTDMALLIDDRACVLSGVCVSLVPHRFALEANGAVVLQPHLLDGDPDADAVADAIACCPAAAISADAGPALGRNA